MRRWTLLTMAGLLSLAIASCGGEETATDTPASPSPAPEAGAPTGVPADAPADAQEPGATEPMVAEKPQTAMPGLIASTNAQARVQQVIKPEIAQTQGTRNPVAVFPFSIPIPESPTPTRTNRQTTAPQATANVPSIPGAPSPNNSPFARVPRTPLAPRSPLPLRRPIAQSPNTTLPQRSPLPGQTAGPTAALPPQPSTDLAEAIKVSGVVQVGNTVRAVVEEPGRPSAYVRVGQRLANGQVLVKRIDLRAGADPVVIFEQNGVEVSRMVGESVAPPAGNGSTPAA